MGTNSSGVTGNPIGSTPEKFPITPKGVNFADEVEVIFEGFFFTANSNTPGIVELP